MLTKGKGLVVGEMNFEDGEWKIKIVCWKWKVGDQVTKESCMCRTIKQYDAGDEMSVVSGIESMGGMNRDTGGKVENFQDRHFCG